MPGRLTEIIGAYDADAPMASARTIPAAWYIDPRVADIERRTVFGRSWLMAARCDQVAEPGRFVTTEIADEPILVIRDPEGVLRAFHNVCRHHAAAVMTAAEGTASVRREAGEQHFHRMLFRDLSDGLGAVDA